MHVKTVYGATLPDSQLEGSMQLSDPPDNHLVCSCGPLTYPTCPPKISPGFLWDNQGH